MNAHMSGVDELNQEMGRGQSGELMLFEKVLARSAKQGLQ